MKKTLKKLSKNKQNIKNHKNLRWIAKHLHIPNLWNFNRKTIAKGVAIGLFVLLFLFHFKCCWQPLWPLYFVVTF